MNKDKLDEIVKNKMKPIPAIILGILCPGLGQAYTNRIKFSLAIAGFFLFLFLLWVYTGMIWHFWGMCVYSLIKYPLNLVLIIEAAVFANKSKLPAVKFKTVAGIGLSYLILFVIVLSVAPYKGFKMPSGSMSPTIQIGDYFMVNKVFYKNKQPVKREIIAFRDPQGSSKIYIKRIVALSGDTVELRNDSLIINSQYVQEPNEFFNKDSIPRYEMRNLAPHIVSTNSLFVLGDDRYNSFDSRNYGDVRMELIVGKMLYIYWSNTLSKIGHSLEILK